MPRQNNVGINITTQVSGKESLQQLRQELERIAGLIRSVSSGNGNGSSWVGGGLYGGTPKEHLQTMLGGGYPAIGETANKALYADAINAGVSYAAGLGVMRTASAAEAQAPPAGASNFNLSPGRITPTSAPVIVPGPDIPGTWMGGGKSVIPPGVGSGPVLNARQRMAIDEQERMERGAYWAAQRGYRNDGLYTGPSPEGWGIGYSGRAQAGRDPINLNNMEAEIASAAKSAEIKSRPQNRAMYGLLFQAFFGAMFGGMQELTQGLATGQRPYGGSYAAAITPFAANMAGMGIGFALGGPVGAMAGGMIGQLGGDLVRSAAEGAHAYQGVQKQLTNYYGERGRTHWSGLDIDWLNGIASNIQGYTPVLQGLSEMAPSLIEAGITDPDQGRWYSEQIKDRFGRDASKEAYGRYAKYLQDPYTRSMFQARRGKFGYSSRDAVGAYLYGGSQTLSDYTTMAGRDYDVAWNNIAPIHNAQEQMMMTQRAWAPWQGVYSQQMGLAMQMGAPGMFAQSYSGSMAAMSASMSSMQQYATSLSPYSGNSAVSQELSKITAGIATLRNSMMEQFVSSAQVPFPAQWETELNQLNTDFYISQRAPMMFAMGANYGGPVGADGVKGLRQTPGNWNQRDILKARNGRLNEMLEFLQGEYGKQSDDLYTKYNSGMIDYDDLQDGLHSYTRDLNVRGNAIRTQMADTYSMLESGWMERLTSQVQGVPGRLVGVMKSFSYDGASKALWNAGFGANRFFGGANLGTALPAASGMFGETVSQRNWGPTEGSTGNGPNITVHNHINVSSAAVDERSLSKLKDQMRDVTIDWANRGANGVRS